MALNANTMFALSAINARTSIKVFIKLSFSYIVGNPLTYLSCAVLCATLNLNLRCTYVGIERSVYSLTYKCTFLIQSEMLKKHSSRKNLGYRVGKVLASCLRP